MHVRRLDEKKVDSKDEKLVLNLNRGLNIVRVQPSELVILHRQCEMKTRLVYFYFKFLSFLFDTFEETAPINPFVAHALIRSIKAKLSLAKREYELISKALDQVLDRTALRGFGETLDQIIENATGFRSMLLVNLRLFLNLEQMISFIGIPESQTLTSVLKQFQTLVNKLDQMLVSVVDATRASGAPPDSLRKQFEEKLKESKEKISVGVGQIIDPQKLLQVLINKILQYYLAPIHKESLKLTRKILLLQRWQLELKNQSEKVLKLFPTKGIKYTLRIKALLFDSKPQFYKTYFEHPAVGQIAAQSLMATTITESPEGKVQPQEIAKKLLGLEKTANETLKDQENGLQDYGWTKGIFTSLIRFWTKGYYYQFSASYFDFFEELTDKERGTLQNVAILNTKLSDNYLSFFTTIGSGLLVKVDSVISEWIGLGSKGYYGIVNVLFTSLLSQLDSFVFYLGELLGLDDERLINALPIIRWVAGLGITISTCAIGFGLGAEAAGYVASGYVIGTLCRDLSGYVFDRAKNRLAGRSMADAVTSATTSSSTTSSSRFLELAIKLPIQHLSFCLGSIYFGPKVYDRLLPLFVTPSRDQLLANTNTCLKFEGACKKEALATLGFNDVKREPTAEEIHVVWRGLMRKQHPDKNKVAGVDAHTSAVELNNARDRLRDLGYISLSPGGLDS